jgi:hypothetical protein
MDAEHIKKVFKKWFVDKEASYTSWGPIDEIA